MFITLSVTKFLRVAVQQWDLKSVLGCPLVRDEVDGVKKYTNLTCTRPKTIL